MNLSTNQRIKLLCEPPQRAAMSQFIGEYDCALLESWLREELGSERMLDDFQARQNAGFCRAIAPKNILHIVSGNTPHAAMQSLFRGLLLGSRNTIKLPSSGLPDLTQWVEGLPEALRGYVRLVSSRDEMRIGEMDAVVAIGSDATTAEIHAQLRPHQIFIPHGHKLSIGVVTDDFREAAPLAASDVCQHEQRGCLSLHAIYVPEAEVKSFAVLLAESMADFAKYTPPPTPSLSLAGAIRNQREVTRFRQANGETVHLHASQDSLNWTVIASHSPTLRASCLGRVVEVKPIPECAGELGAEAGFLSTIALHPFHSETAKDYANWGASRICPLGQSQQPSLFWHHDGFAPLAGLVKWQDIG